MVFKFSVIGLTTLCSNANDLFKKLQVDNSRKHASIPIPAPILARVRELAEIEGHFPPNISRVKFAGHSVRDVHERRSGYL